MNDKSEKIELAEELEANSSELSTYTAAAIDLMMKMAGDRKIEVAVIVGDSNTHELMLSGQCCPGCTANLIQAAMEICEKLEADGKIEPNNEKQN